MSPMTMLFFFFSLMHSMNLVMMLTVPYRLYGWRLQNSTQKLKNCFTGLRKTAGHQSPCLCPGQTGSPRMTVRTLCTSMMPHIFMDRNKKVFFFVFLNRCGLVISYQRQPGPAMLPVDSGWQNIPRSRSSIRQCEVAEGYARIFHPTRVICGDFSTPPPKKKPTMRCQKCLTDSYLQTFFYHALWIVHVQYMQ